MARGITESDVHSAADEIVSGGERPTVERIRAHLGTGSPNTVTRWLETWWQGLGLRLQAQQGRLAIPEAPETVAVLAGEWWAMALEHARSAALKAVAAERSALQESQEALRQDREDFAAEAASVNAKAEAAIQAERLATAQAVELQRLIRQLEGRIEEASRQRDAALARADDAEATRQALDTRLQALQEAAQSEREGLTRHVQSVEDRAHAEIDRARQETRQLQARLAAAAKEHAVVEKSLRNAADQAKAAANEASRAAGAERARADAIEAQLTKLQDLPAAVEAAMLRREIQPKQRKSRSKRAVPR